MTTLDTVHETELRQRDLDRRRAALRQKLRNAGLELLLLYATRNHSFFQSMNTLWWATGFKQMGPHAALVLPAEGETLLVITPTWDLARARERAAGIDSIVASDPDAFFQTMSTELGKRGLLGKRTAFASGFVATLGSGQNRQTAAAWRGVLSAEPVSFDTAVSDLAKVRDEWSLYCARRATDIAEQGYARMLEAARPGMPEHEVAGLLDVYMRELGAEDNFLIVSASQHNRLVHQPTNRRLEAGDVLLGEISPSYEGEYVQICRTAVIGKPTALQSEKFALLDHALRAGMQAATPGTPAATVVEAINQPLNEAGYGTYTRQPYMRTRGHSCGLGSMDPQIDLIHDHVLQEGMVFVMHPNQYIPETGYFMCGEPVRITPKGAEPLTARMGTLDSIDWR